MPVRQGQGAMLDREIYKITETAEAPPREAVAREAWTFKDLATELHAGRWLLLGLVLVGLAVGLVAVALTQPQYTARLRIAPVEAVPDDGRLRRLAALLPGAIDGSTSSMPEFLTLVRSERLARELDSRYGLRERIFPFDPARNRFLEPDRLIDTLRYAIREALGLPGWSPPTAANLADYLQDRVVVEPAAEHGVYELRFSHPDPGFAADLLLWLYQGADTLVREGQRLRTDRYVEFLTDRLQAEQNVEIRTALRSLLLQQMQNRMLTHVDVPFAAKLLDGPHVDADPTTPRLGRTVLIAMLTGFALGVVVVFVRAALR